MTTKGFAEPMALEGAFDETLRRAQAGDRDALATLYSDVAPLVIGYLRAQRAADAEDLAGDVFVALVTNLSSFDGDERHFRSWLLTIAHRRLIDDVRRRTRRPEHRDPVEDLLATLYADDVLETDVLARVAADRIIAAIDDLSEQQRAAVMLRVLADLSISETARVLGKPETAVKALLRRATRNLRKALPDDRLMPVAAPGAAAVQPGGARHG